MNKRFGTFVCGVSLITVFLLSSGIFLVVGATSPPSFNPAFNLSNDSNSAQYPNVQSSGSSVYVVWTEKSHGIQFRSSPDEGSTWNPSLSSAPLRISPTVGGTSNYPLMAAYGSYVYVVWTQTTSTNKVSQIYFASSSDSGVAFNPAIIVDTNPTTAASTPVIAAYGNYVYVVLDCRIRLVRNCERQ